MGARVQFDYVHGVRREHDGSAPNARVPTRNRASVRPTRHHDKERPGSGLCPLGPVPMEEDDHVTTYQ